MTNNCQQNTEQKTKDWTTNTNLTHKTLSRKLKIKQQHKSHPQNTEQKTKDWTTNTNLNHKTLSRKLKIEQPTQISPTKHWAEN